MSPYREAPKLGARIEPGRWRRLGHWFARCTWSLQVTVGRVRVLRCEVCGALRLEQSVWGFTDLHHHPLKEWEPVTYEEFINQNYAIHPFEPAWEQLQQLPRWK